MSITYNKVGCLILNSVKYNKQKKGKTLALVDNKKDILPLSSIAELLTTKIRTLKMYEEKGLLPPKEENKKLYSIDDVKFIAFTHYLASVKKINANGIKYILEMLHNNMDEQNRDKFLSLVEKKMEQLSGIDIKDVETM